MKELKKKSSQATALVEIAERSCELFTDENAEAYVQIPKEGHLKHIKWNQQFLELGYLNLLAQKEEVANISMRSA